MSSNKKPTNKQANQSDNHNNDPITKTKEPMRMGFVGVLAYQIKPQNLVPKRKAIEPKQKIPIVVQAAKE